MLPRVLEPDVMDSAEEAADYDAMDHSEVNRRFVEELLAAIGNSEFRIQNSETEKRPDSNSEFCLLNSAFLDILDLGTGTALIPIELCKRFADCRVMAADAAVSMLELARYNLEVENLTHRIQLAHVDAKKLPFADGTFDLVCAMDIVEHVADDEGALAELARVSAPEAILLLSVPLHPQAWNAFDEFVGHCRRYEPQAIADKLARHGFTLERSAVYGMQPKSSRLLDLGIWFLRRHPRTAMRWYNRVFMPLGLRMQKPLHWTAGMVSVQGVDEVLLICRRGRRVKA